MRKYNDKSSIVYLTAEEINNMHDDELIGVNRIAINSRITQLQIQGSKDKEALEILIRESRQIKEREKRCRLTLWGAKMTVKDVKIAFGDLTKQMGIAFKKV